MKVAVNKCFGGFGLSDKAYEKLIEYGVPVVKYEQEERDEDGRYKHVDYGKSIFDRTLEDNEDSRSMMDVMGRYWETWIEKDRENTLLIRVIEELGDEASGRFAELRIIDIPDGIDYEIDEYDGLESIHEVHRSW